MKKITSSMVTVIAIVAILPTTFVYAQTTTSNTTATNTTGNASTTSAPIQPVAPSATAQQIINNTKTECEQAQFPEARCVNLSYESPTTVVLQGVIKIFGGSPGSRSFQPNAFLWDAVDDFKAQGYTISAVEMNIASNRTNDNEFHIIMSK